MHEETCSVPAAHMAAHGAAQLCMLHVVCCMFHVAHTCAGAAAHGAAPRGGVRRARRVMVSTWHGRWPGVLNKQTNKPRQRGGHGTTRTAELQEKVERDTHRSPVRAAWLADRERACCICASDTSECCVAGCSFARQHTAVATGLHGQRSRCMRVRCAVVLVQHGPTCCNMAQAVATQYNVPCRGSEAAPTQGWRCYFPRPPTPDCRSGRRTRNTYVPKGNACPPSAQL